MTGTAFAKEACYIWVIFSRTHTGMGKLIRTVTGAEYNHVSVCLNGDLGKVYSFARYRVNSPLAGGFVHESPERLLWGGLDTEVEIYAIPLTGAGYQRISERIGQCCAMEHGRLLYNSFGAALSALGLRFFVPNAYTCLDFASELLGQENITSIPQLRQRLQPHLAYQGGLRKLCLPLLRAPKRVPDPYFECRTHQQVIGDTIRHFLHLSIRVALVLSFFL
ncbi:MAG: hypothetical protein ACOX6P_07785 [Candidatus Merdivicinus sp.]|jgi:hypothetical protein